MWFVVFGYRFFFLYSFAYRHRSPKTKNRMWSGSGIGIGFAIWHCHIHLVSIYKAIGLFVFFFLVFLILSFAIFFRFRFCERKRGKNPQKCVICPIVCENRTALIYSKDVHCSNSSNIDGSINIFLVQFPVGSFEWAFSSFFRFLFIQSLGLSVPFYLLMHFIGNRECKPFKIKNCFVKS